MERTVLHERIGRRIVGRSTELDITYHVSGLGDDERARTVLAGLKDERCRRRQSARRLQGERNAARDARGSFPRVFRTQMVDRADIVRRIVAPTEVDARRGLRRPRIRGHHRLEIIDAVVFLVRIKFGATRTNGDGRDPRFSREVRHRGITALTGDERTIVDQDIRRAINVLARKDERRVRIIKTGTIANTDRRMIRGCLVIVLDARHLQITTTDVDQGVGACGATRR